jgi:hypothetical protein
VSAAGSTGGRVSAGSTESDIKSQLRIDRRQLGLGGADQSRLFNRFSGRPGIKSIKNGGANENREKQGDYIHAYAEK